MGAELSDVSHRTALAREGDALIALAHAMAGVRSDFAALETTEKDVAAALAGGDCFALEQKLERASRKLRAAWLRSVAGETARVLRSPTEAESEALARRHDAYGYERDFEPEALEARCARFFPASPQRTASHILFSSGQAALAGLLWALGEASSGKLAVAHHGCYFETRDLCARTCQTQSFERAQCVIAEPVGCDGAFFSYDVGQIAAAMTAPGQVLVIDETLTAPQSVLPSVLEAAPASLTIVGLVSGLKLLQQGLELANVGILSLHGDQNGVAHLAETLKRMRTLTGGSLRFVDALGLEAPFFLDRAATQTYAGGIFEHNARLARGVAEHNRIFENVEHPALQGAGVAPYCAFRLRDRDPARFSALIETIEHETARRRLLFDRGGSFGFRGHRFEVIEPETGEAPFLRVAMGYRAGRSCEGVIELMSDIAAGA